MPVAVPGWRAGTFLAGASIDAAGVGARDRSQWIGSGGGWVPGAVQDALGDGEEAVAGGGGGVVEQVAGLFGAAALGGHQHALGADRDDCFLVVGSQLVATLTGGGEDVGTGDGVGRLAAGEAGDVIGRVVE